MITKEHVRNIVATMRERQIRPDKNGDYEMRIHGSRARDAFEAGFGRSVQ